MKTKKDYFYNARVRRVVDGDSLRVDIDLGFNAWLNNQQLRLMGPGGRAFDAPEWNTPDGAAAKDWLKELLQADGAFDIEIVLQTFKAAKHDRYERWLATVWLKNGTDGDLDIASQMVDLGLAQWTGPEPVRAAEPGQGG